MLISFLNFDNYGNYNIKVAQTFGLEFSVYCNWIISIVDKAGRKKKLVDNKYIKLDRRYITEVTTLPEKRQLEIDAELIKLGVLEYCCEDTTLLYLDTKSFVSIVMDDDLEQLEETLKQSKVKMTRQLKAKAKEAKQRRILDNLYSTVSERCKNKELYQAYCDWIDVVVSKFGFMSKESINNFMSSVDNFSKRDLDVALDLVRRATNLGYREFQWVANNYRNVSQNQPRVTEQRVATAETVDENIIF